MSVQGSGHAQVGVLGVGMGIGRWAWQAGVMGGTPHVPNTSTLVFVENIGHKYDFQWGGVVSGRLWVLGWVVQIQGNKCFPQNKLIWTYSKFI